MSVPWWVIANVCDCALVAPDWAIYDEYWSNQLFWPIRWVKYIHHSSSCICSCTLRWLNMTAWWKCESQGFTTSSAVQLACHTRYCRHPACISGISPLWHVVLRWLRVHAFKSPKSILGAACCISWDVSRGISPFRSEDVEKLQENNLEFLRIPKKIYHWQHSKIMMVLHPHRWQTSRILI